MKPLPIRSMDELDALGKIYAQSGVFGDINPAVGTVIAQHVYQTGSTPVEFAANYDVLGSKISPKAKYLLARLLAVGGSYDIHDYDDTKVSISFSYGKVSRTITTTIEDAERAGLTRDGKGRIKSMWQRFPRRMLFARVVSEGVGVVAPNVNAGLYTPEEVSDFDGRDVDIDDGEAVPTPVPQAAAQPPADPSVCNLECPYKGQKWEMLSDDLLNAALDFDGTPSASKDYIRAVLSARLSATQTPTNNPEEGDNQ